jgi:carbon monoxide dehydrogenase subunit G
MLIEGKFTLQAPIQQIWDFFLDPETLVTCIPGAEKMEAIDDKTYESIVKQKVGPVVVTFAFTTTLSKMDPPRYLEATGSGHEIHKIGTFSQKTTVSLTEVEENTVEISYASNVSLVGRLATFGDRIMRAKAKKMGEEVTKNFEERLKSQIAQSESDSDSVTSDSITGTKGVDDNDRF